MIGREKERAVAAIEEGRLMTDQENIHAILLRDRRRACR